MNLIEQSLMMYLTMFIVLVCLILIYFILMFAVCYIDRDCCFYFLRRPKIRDYSDKNDLEL